MIVKDNKSILTHNDILAFIYSKNENPTPIRIQKFSYFAYAYWFSYQTKISNISNSLELYPAEFQAWKFGPVDVEIYNMNKTTRESKFELNLTKEVENFLNYMWKSLLKLNDFQLVALSHNDNGWIKAYNEEDFSHNNIISSELIIEQYKKMDFKYE